MKTYLISYDLAAPHTKKHAVAEAIMALGTRWARPLEQTWYVEASGSAAGLEAMLGGLIDENDGLVIQAVEKRAVMANTTLRWFRQRRAAPKPFEGARIIEFPVANDATETGFEEYYAKAS